MYNLRGGFLVRPLIIALTLGFAGAMFSWLEETFPFLSDFVPRALFPSHADPQVAQVLLGGIAASIMTVVSIVFAIVLMTLTLASMQFSPRIIVSFARDRVTQWTLGIFLGTFCYCMAALPAARSLPHPFAPVATVMGAMLLALACVGWLLFFIHHITQAISVSHIVDRIATETVAMLDLLMPEPRAAGVGLQEPSPAGGEETPILSEESGYIRFIDIPALVIVAKACHVTLRVSRRVGQFIPAGTPLLLATKAGRLTPKSSPRSATPSTWVRTKSMAKKSSASSRRGKLISVSAESIFSRPLNKRQKAVLARIAKRQAAGEDSDIDYSDIPPLTDEQLAQFRRAPKVLIAARLDRDIYDWLRRYGAGYSTRINNILRAVMSRMR